METFLAQWGLELVLGLSTAAALAFCRYFYAKYKRYKLHEEETKNKEIETQIETSLDPIYQELEDLRTYIRKTADVEEHHMQLIIASYRFRLIQLCKEFIRQGYLTQKQYDQLVEFYKLYTGLGGNGQAKVYYEKAIVLPIRDE